MTQQVDIEFDKGVTFSRVIRWEVPPLIYVPITAITKAGPVKITAVGHGLPDGWRAAVVSAQGMRQINAKNWPLNDDDFHKVTVVDADNVQFNDVNSLDFTAYTSGGSLVYWTPQSLAGVTVAWDVYASEDDMSASLLSIGCVTDNTLKTITGTVTAANTAAITFLQGWHEMLATSGAVVTELLEGTVVVEN